MLSNLKSGTLNYSLYQGIQFLMMWPIQYQMKVKQKFHQTKKRLHTRVLCLYSISVKKFCL